MREKLGLFNEGANDIELINELLVLMQKIELTIPLHLDIFRQMQF